MTINNKIVSEFREIKSLYDAGKTRFAVRNGACEKVIVRENTNDGEKYTVELREIVSKNRTNLLAQTTFNISRKGELKKDYSNFKTAVFGTKTVKMASAEKPSASASVPKKAAQSNKPVKVGIDEEIARLKGKIEKMQDNYGKATAKGYLAQKAWTKEHSNLVDRKNALEKQKRTGQLQVERTHIEEEPVASAKKSSGQTKKPAAPVKEAAEELTSRGLSAPVSPKVRVNEKPLEIPKGASYTLNPTYDNPETHPVYEIVGELKELIKKCPEKTAQNGDETISRNGNSFKVSKPDGSTIIFDISERSGNNLYITRVERWEDGSLANAKSISCKDELIRQAYRSGEQFSFDSLPEAKPLGEFVEENKQRQSVEERAEQEAIASLGKNDPAGILNEYNSLCSLTEGGSAKPLGGGVYSNRQSVVSGDKNIESVAKEDWIKGTTLTRSITVTERSPEGTTTTSYAFRLIDEATGKHRITKLSYGPHGESKVTIEDGIVVKDEGGA